MFKLHVTRGIRFHEENLKLAKLEEVAISILKNPLSSSLLLKNLKIKIYRTIILPVVLYGCDTWSLILREERRLRVFENWVLRRIFGPKREEVTEEGQNYIMRSLMISTPRPVLCGCSNREE